MPPADTTLTTKTTWNQPTLQVRKSIFIDLVVYLLLFMFVYQLVTIVKSYPFTELTLGNTDSFTAFNILFAYVELNSRA